MKAIFRSRTIGIAFAAAVVACAAITGGRASADVPPGVKLPAPVSLLNQIVIDHGYVATKPFGITLPPIYVGSNFGDTVQNRRVPVLTPKFDTSIYCVYGIMIGENGAQALVGQVASDAQVVHIGDYIGDTPARVVQITGSSIMVQTGNGPMQRIGFYGGGASLDPR